MQEICFLSNTENKQRFVCMLGDALQDVGHNVVHSKDDADVQIVVESLKSVRQVDTVLVGENTGLDYL